MRILVNKCRRNYRTRNFLENPTAVIVAQKNHWWLLKSVSKNTVRNRILTGSQSFPQGLFMTMGEKAALQWRNQAAALAKGPT